MEIWKPIKGFEGVYEISTLGRVRNTNWRGQGYRLVKLHHDKDGVLIKTWVSLNEIGRQTGYDITHIMRVCKGIKNTGYGYKWEYA